MITFASCGHNSRGSSSSGAEIGRHPAQGPEQALYSTRAPMASWPCDRAASMSPAIESFAGRSRPVARRARQLTEDVGQRLASDARPSSGARTICDGERGAGPATAHAARPRQGPEHPRPDAAGGSTDRATRSEVRDAVVVRPAPSARHAGCGDGLPAHVLQALWGTTEGRILRAAACSIRLPTPAARTPRPPQDFTGQFGGADWRGKQVRRLPVGVPEARAVTCILGPHRRSRGAGEQGIPVIETTAASWAASMAAFR